MKGLLLNSGSLPLTLPRVKFLQVVESRNQYFRYESNYWGLKLETRVSLIY